MAWRGCAAVMLLLAAAVQLVPSGGADACAALGAPTRALQDDAASGRDAPDALPALPLSPAEADGGNAAYVWAWLDPPVPREGADLNDWYLVTLNGATDAFMVNVTSNYTLASDYYTEFRLQVLSPLGDAYTTTSSGPALLLPNVAGDWLLRVTTGDAPPCAEAPLPGAGTPAQRNHGIYFGCHPVCVDTK